MKRLKRLAFTDKEMNEVYKLLDSKNLLFDKTINMVDNFKGNKDYNFQYRTSDEDEKNTYDTSEYQTTIKGRILYNFIEGSYDKYGYEYAEEYFLTEKGIILLHAPYNGSYDGNNENYYYWGYSTSSKLESMTSLDVILKVMNYGQPKIDDETINEIKNILLK